MKCAEIKYKLNDYINNKLNAFEKAEFEKHLESCGGCRSELVFLKKYNEKIDRLETLDTSPDFMEKLNARIDKEESGNFFKKIFLSFPEINFKYPLLAAGFALVLIIVIPALVFMFPHVKQENKVAINKTETVSKTLTENKNVPVSTEKDKVVLSKKETAAETSAGNKSAAVSTEKDKAPLKKSETAEESITLNKNSLVSSEKNKTAFTDDKMEDIKTTGKGELSLNSKAETPKIEIKKSKENLREKLYEVNIINIVLETSGLFDSKIAMPNLSRSQYYETSAPESEDSFKKGASSSAVREESGKKIETDEKSAENIESRRIYKSDEKKELNSEKEIFDINKFNGRIVSGSEETGEITVEIPLSYYQSFINMLKTKGKLSGNIPQTSDLQTEKILIKIEIKKM
jgi:hypothetical protein